MAALSDDPALREESPVHFRLWPLLLVAAAAALVGLLPLGLPEAAHRTWIVLVVVGGLWLSEAVPVAVGALVVPPLALLLGITDVQGAFAGFGDPIVFLFFGTFLLTEAAAVHGLNDRLAGAVLGSRWVGERPERLLWAVAALGCGLSAWMNNTATTALLLPLALTAQRFASPRLLTGILLMTSYAPTLGGLATPVGTAPNLIGLRLLEQATGARPSFAVWCATFAPLAILFTLVTAVWLRFTAGRNAVERPIASTAAESRRGPWSLAERTLVPLFVVVVLLWITPGILAATPWAKASWVKLWQARLPEPAVPMLGGLALFLLPARTGARAPRILDASVLRRIDWSTILLFGGGLTLGRLMLETGLAKALGESIFRSLPVHGAYGVVLAATLMGVLVSEVTSNTASASLVVPVVLALAKAAGVDPVAPALAATVACSFGFMLPVSTPPNGLVYATGRVRMRDMIVLGVLLDLLGVGVVSAWVHWFA